MIMWPVESRGRAYEEKSMQRCCCCHEPERWRAGLNYLSAGLTALVALESISPQHCFVDLVARLGSWD